MPENTRTRMLLPNLENVLVQEFRLVQSLIDITRDERNFLPTSNAEDLMGLVEKKENVLDQMSLLEERRRTLLIDLARDMGLSLESTSLGDILPWLDPTTAGRLNRLSEGIAMLVGQARDLNYGNRAMATSALDWLESTKAFLYGYYQNQLAYTAPGSPVSLEQPASWDVDQRA
jgi:flagellar biosynthesis/type III secretory pathway chaperone